MKRILAALAAVALFAGAAAPALAHPDIVHARPGAGAVVPAGVTELRLAFSEPLFVNFSGVVVTDARGKKLKTGKAKLSPNDPKVLVVPFAAPLPAGTYTVQWHAVSGDTHRITGRYRFTVQ